MVKALLRREIANITLFADSNGACWRYCSGSAWVLELWSMVRTSETEFKSRAWGAVVEFYEALGFEANPSGVRCVSAGCL